MRPADTQCRPVLVGARDDGADGVGEPVQDQLSGLLHLERERRVDDVRRREAVVEPPPDRTEPLGDGVDERGGVVVEPGLELRDALR